MTLIVTDSRGAHSTAVVPVQILSSVTHLQLHLTPATVQASQIVTLVAQPVNLPPGDHIAQYTWDFGDQTEPQVTSTGTITHRYIQPGTYLVQVRVVDTEQRPGEVTAQVIVQPAGSDSLRAIAWGCWGSWGWWVSSCLFAGDVCMLWFHRQKPRSRECTGCNDPLLPALEIALKFFRLCRGTGQRSRSYRRIV